MITNEAAKGLKSKYPNQILVKENRGNGEGKQNAVAIWLELSEQSQTVLKALLIWNR